MTEADDDKNRKFGFLEFSALMIDCKSGALRSKEPVYTEEKAEAAFSASAENSKEADKKHQMCNRHTEEASSNKQF